MKVVQPQRVDMVCPFCDRPVRNDSGPRVDVSKLTKQPKGSLRYAHEVCYEEAVNHLQEQV